LGLAACDEREPGALERAAGEIRTADPVAYEVTVTGVEDEALASFLSEVSTAAAGAGQPAPSLLALRRRALADEDRLADALSGEGYYEASVTASISVPDDGPAEVTLDVTTGPRYALAEIDILVRGAAGGYTPPSPGDLGLETGQPAMAQAIIDAEQALLRDARTAGHAYAELGDRRAVIDRAAKTLDATLIIAPGPSITLGEVTFEGVDGIDEPFLRRRVPWEPGTAYDPELVTEIRRELVASRLFRSVQIQLPENPPADGHAPVTVVTEQRLHRTIGAGVRFETDGGPGGSASWEHRNAFGGAERFRVELDADLLRQSLSASLRTPDFFGRSRSFISEAALVREDTDAFDSLAANASVGVEQRFGDTLTGTLGVGYELSEITDETGTESFGLLFVPGTLRFDNTESPLDPQRGVRARLEATPHWDTLGQDLFFQRFRVSGSTYFKLTDSPRVIFALRGTVGSIIGAERDDIPANRRFYAGGGGSIRGIPFQLASPLDADDDPLGGRSLLEVAGEFRFNITETIGAVAFVDAGRAFEATFPDFADPLVVGAGVGLRYFTPIGPLRLDVAVPVDRRDVDDAFQIYVSLGQAF